jgi:DNA-directed RNA polymerase subunit L
MIPSIKKKTEENNTLTFTLSNINTSLANAVRRTIISDIPLVVFKTFPHSENLVDIHKNTTRLNNEILKQRLGCIPIHIDDRDFPIQDYIVEMNVTNTTDSILYITTKDFKLKNIKSGKYATEKTRKKIFPPNPITKDYIIFARLKPKISSDLPGEELSLTAKLSWATAKESGMFNTVSTCSYRMTPDTIVQDQQWSEISKGEKKPKDAKKNWLLLDGKRCCKKDSFDFIVESVGIYTNNEIVSKACSIIINKLTFISEQSVQIAKSPVTIPNCFDIKLENEDYTIGKIIEYVLYTDYFEHDKVLSFIGFKKDHPHDLHSIIRIATIEPGNVTTVHGYFVDSCKKLIKLYQKIQLFFE